MGETLTFRDGVLWAQPAQLAVASYLNSKGLKVTVPEFRYRPSYALNAEYSDAGDVIDEDGNTFEVQRRRVPFAGRSTFPWPNMLTVQCEKIEQIERLGKQIRGVFSVSSDLQVAAYVNYAQTREHWFIKTVTDQKPTRLLKRVYMCPLEHVKFVALTREKGETADREGEERNPAVS